MKLNSSWFKLSSNHCTFFLTSMMLMFCVIRKLSNQLYSGSNPCAFVGISAYCQKVEDDLRTCKIILYPYFNFAMEGYLWIKATDLCAIFTFTKTLHELWSDPESGIAWFNLLYPLKCPVYTQHLCQVTLMSRFHLFYGFMGQYAVQLVQYNFWSIIHPLSHDCKHFLKVQTQIQSLISSPNERKHSP